MIILKRRIKFLAPEIFLQMNKSSSLGFTLANKGEIWSLGIILLTLLNPEANTELGTIGYIKELIQLQYKYKD